MQEMQKRTRKIGLPPETLVYTGEYTAALPQLALTVYDAEQYQHTAHATLEQCLTAPVENKVIWLHVIGLHQTDLIERITRHFNIHPLIAEDILHTDQRAKVEEFPDYLFVTLKALNWDEKAQKFSAKQISIVLGRGFVLTFQECASDLFNKIQERLRYAQSRLRDNQSDYLTYALLDTIVDHYFLILENLGDLIEKVENEVIGKTAAASAQALYKLKQQMFKLRKTAWPLREVISHLLRSEANLINQNTVVYLRDVYDHTIAIIETVEAFHDRLDSLLDVYLSSLTNRMNEIMKVLTIIATIFIPMTFIASIYGMNFHYMPELQWHYGYPLVLLLMSGVAVGMMIYFKRKKWW